MNRLSKAILIIIITVVALVAALVLGVNLYVQSPGVKARIQSQLSQALGVPIEMTTMSVGWSGARLAGVSVPFPEGKPFLEADSLAADFSFIPLLRQQLMIRKITLASPKILWAQNAEGKWVLPGIPVKAAKESPLAEPAEKKEKKEKERFQTVLDRVEITDGSIELLDSRQHRIALASGVEMHFTMPGQEEIAGTAGAHSITWSEAVTISDVQSDVRYADGELVFADVHGVFGGGSVKAKAAVHTKTKESPYELELRLEGVDLAKLAGEGGAKTSQAAGTLSGSVTATGELGQPGEAHGKVALSMVDGRIRGLEVFQAIGQVLDIPDLADLRVHDGHLDAEFGGERVHVSELVLETPDLKFDAKGVMQYNEKLKMDAGLYFSDKVAQRFPSFVRDKLSAPDEAGRKGLAFAISGSLGRPRTDLWDKIIGKGLNDQLGDFVGSLFGRKKEKKKKEKPETPPVEVVAPVANPGAPPPTGEAKPAEGSTPTPASPGAPSSAPGEP